MVKNKVIKNKGKSIRDRLLILSKKASYEYNLLLTRYVQERMLFRLSQSKYKEMFLLKGGALLYAHNRFKSRPTIDIDFLAKNLSNDKENIKTVFNEILSIQSNDDALTFDLQNIIVEDIMEGKNYHGVRLNTKAVLDNMPLHLSIDIGFGDITIPAPQELAYPVILDEMSSFSVKAYSLETVVAEKFHTMIDLSIYNSRMKDFFDLYTILSTKDLDSANLTEAIKATFKNRHTEYVENHALFKEEFFQDTTKTNQWNSFLQKIKYKDQLTFLDVGKLIQEKMKPYWEALSPKE
jgi:predicted nucleotidyltransferase component of viral defense system